MSDPFAIRMNFKRSYLEKLTSNPASQMRAAAYAIKYREQDEDLHSCILEQLDAANINLRANIMYFIEFLCDLAARESCLQYISNITRDLPTIVDLVAPGTKAGAMNIKVVLKVLQSLANKGILRTDLVADLTARVDSRSSAAASQIAVAPQADITVSAPERTDQINVLDETAIEQRMEEDRERHKRLREDAWAVEWEKEAQAMVDAARKAGGLTDKLLQECRDDANERTIAVELDRKKWDEVIRGGDGDIEMG